MINFKPLTTTYLTEIKEILLENQWFSYLHDDQLLIEAFQNSLEVLGAFNESDELIGYIRCVGDGAHVVLIQDLILKKAYQRQGIGTKLIQYIFDKYAHVRMLLVITDLEDEMDNNFYQKQKMHVIKDKHMIAYIR